MFYSFSFECSEWQLDSCKLDVRDSIVVVGFGRGDVIGEDVEAATCDHVRPFQLIFAFGKASSNLFSRT